MSIVDSNKGKMVEDHTVLSDLGVQSGQTVQVEIQSADPVNRPLQYRKASPAYKLPDNVKVKVEVGKYQDLLCTLYLPKSFQTKMGKDYNSVKR